MKKFLILSLALILIISMSACRGSPAATATTAATTAAATAATATTTASTEKPTTETVAPAVDSTTVHFYGHSDKRTLYEGMVDAYNAVDNGVTMELHIIENDAYDDKVKVLAAGSADVLDCFMVRGPAIANQYIANNALADLSGFAAESGVDLAPMRSMLDAISVGSSFYGLIPGKGSAWLLFYNKDLFDARNLDYPVGLTWDQYADLAKELTYEEDGVKYMGGGIPPWVMNLGASPSGEYLTHETMPNTRKYAEVLNRMYNVDKSHPGIAEMKSGAFDINAFFESGTTYMMINGTWTYQMFGDKGGEFNLGAAPLPIFEGLPANSTVGSFSVWAISQHSKVQKEAYNFLEFATTSETGAQVIAKDNAIPVIEYESSTKIFNDNMGGAFGLEHWMNADIHPEQGYESYYSKLNETYAGELDLYLLGEESLDDCMDNYFALRENIIAEE